MIRKVLRKIKQAVKWVLSLLNIEFIGDDYIDIHWGSDEFTDYWLLNLTIVKKTLRSPWTMKVIWILNKCLMDDGLWQGKLSFLNKKKKKRSKKQ